MSSVPASKAETHVAVLMGGPSSEHDVSIKSGTAIAEALATAGYMVTPIAFEKAALPELPESTSVVFPALHGAFGEDGGIQTLLDDAGIPYVGSGATASRLMMDKHESKKVLARLDILVAGDALISDPGATVPEDLQFPLIVKPNREGSTIGLTLIRDEAEFP